MDPDVAYLWRQMRIHAALFFDASVQARLNPDTVLFLPWSEAVHRTGPCVVIPTDVPVAEGSDHPYRVPFNGTELTLWSRLPEPAVPGWALFPGEDRPLWYRHRSGTLLPAWNLFGNLFGLLTFGEERRSTQRDEHGRFVARFSWRDDRGLLEVPAFNEAVAALVDACTALASDAQPALRLDDMLNPPVVVLSHDCDVLYGNDRWTQAIRMYRTLEPLLRVRLPRLANLWWLARNAVMPRRFYFDNLAGMRDLERGYGYRSTFYLLNGAGGRFGARNGDRGLDELVASLPPGWNVGIHYNYDTYLNRERFEAQRNQLQDLVGIDIVAGRAHYLRFDPARSLPFLESLGIEVDESSGYSDRVGYRNGIGGCFEAYTPDTHTRHRIVEVPMVIMDTTLVDQYADSSTAAVRRLLAHLRRVGGALTIVFHPGIFHNPEFPNMLGVYQQLLIECRRAGARSRTAADLLAHLRQAAGGWYA